MITWVRSANINTGKRDGAIEWALRISAYVGDTFGTNVNVQGNVAGPYNQIHWVATYDSLAALEKASARFFQDDGYLSLLAESTAAGFFDTHSINDAIYRTLG